MALPTIWPLRCRGSTLNPREAPTKSLGKINVKLPHSAQKYEWAPYLFWACVQDRHSILMVADICKVVKLAKYVLAFVIEADYSYKTTTLTATF